MPLLPISQMRKGRQRKLKSLSMVIQPVRVDLAQVPHTNTALTTLDKGAQVAKPDLASHLQ